MADTTAHRLVVFSRAARMAIEGSPPGKIVIVESGTGQVGVVVDDVEEVLTVATEQLENVPSASSDAIEAIAKVGDRLVIRLADHTVRSVAGHRMPVMRDAALRIVDAAQRFGRCPAPQAGYAVIVRGGAGSLAVTVTTLFGQRELVTRPLPPEVAENSALSGAAVMSDGQIALIVDRDALETSTHLLAA